MEFKMTSFYNIFQVSPILEVHAFKVQKMVDFLRKFLSYEVSKSGGKISNLRDFKFFYYSYFALSLEQLN